MNSICLRLVIALCLTAIVPKVVRAQQVADPNFDATVVKPAYTSRRPHVLFDEAHNNLNKANGRYMPLVKLIANDGYEVVPNAERFSAQSLQGFNILVISNAIGPAARQADPAFSDEECDAVRDWVRAGGALLLIADHYPLGSANANLSRRFGVDMSTGFTDDPGNFYDQQGDLLFSRENKLLGDHAIIQGRSNAERINRAATFVGQSLKGPADSAALLKLPDTAFDLMPPDDKKVSAAGRAQGIAMKFGRGRVVVLGEAAMLTAQLFGPNRVPFGGLGLKDIDNRQLALNIFHWLSKLLN